MTIPVGKLPPGLLGALLTLLASDDPDVVVGPGVGEDAAAVRVGDRVLVLAMDPVTMSRTPGRIAVAVNANDIAVMGATPRWLLATVLYPPSESEDGVVAIMQDLRQAATAMHVAIVGGHTEVTPAVTSAVVAACMIGEVTADRLVRGAGAAAGDSLVVAGAVAIEGTGILARDHAAALRVAGVDAQSIAAAGSLLEHPGISVLPAVQALMEVAQPHAMHDPTEGGVLGAIAEMATAAGLGVLVEADAIPILPECLDICRALALDPLRLLASGSLLAALSPEDVAAALTALEQHGIPAAVIGIFTEEQTCRVRRGTDVQEFASGPDELARWLSMPS